MKLLQLLRRRPWALPPLLTLIFFIGVVAHVRAEVRQVASVRASEAWVRSTPPGASAGAAYVTLHNESSQPLLVTQVRSDVSGIAQLHEMSLDGGVMRMRHLSSGLRLKPGATVKLEPGGLHVMLMDLKQPLRAGQSVLLHFSLSDGRELSIVAPVRDAQP
ncbi:hypothetical protein SAMN04488038_102163 [Solimonas aquatica]|uniref:Copper(I)-binding protein n=1 Tax=Solimonas aquatica TaxID=489703 RepID=A0A1H9BP80_9GAMM|nr:copper chaperone PCu(A)C [Solimonas aquatica]SEP90561.1 hypothetical protein SAMN04488038_102163 [Solimonas aquatica]